MKRRYYPAEGAYSTDDFHITFTAEICDDSAPDEMPGRDVENVQITALNILGIDVELKKLPPALQDAIWTLAREVDWERVDG